MAALQLFKAILSPLTWYVPLLIVLFIHFSFFLALGMTSDFQLKAGHFLLGYETYLNLLF